MSDTSRPYQDIKTLQQPFSLPHGAAHCCRLVVNRPSALSVSRVTCRLDPDRDGVQVHTYIRHRAAAEFLHQFSFCLRLDLKRLTRSCACISRSSAQTSLLSMRFAMPSRGGAPESATDVCPTHLGLDDGAPRHNSGGYSSFVLDQGMYPPHDPSRPAVLRCLAPVARK